MRAIASFVGITLLGLLLPPVARADHGHLLHTTTSAYHEAVNRFELLIDHRPIVSSYTDRYVHRLGEAACALHDVAAHPSDLYRIQCAFDEVVVLHRRVQSLLASPGQRPDATAARMWVDVACALDRVCESIDYLAATTVASARPIVIATPHGGYPPSGLYGADRYGTLRPTYSSHGASHAPHVPSPGLSHHTADHDAFRYPSVGRRDIRDRSADLRAQMIGSVLTHLLD